MHLDAIATAPPTPAAARPDRRVDANGQAFRRTLEDVIRARDPNDVDGDGVVSEAERFLAKLRELAEQLALEALARPGRVDHAQLAKAQQAMNRLIGDMTERIQSGEPISREDLADISAEAIEIYQWGTTPPAEVDPNDDPANPAIDGRIEWRADRPGAVLSDLTLLDAPVPPPGIQRVTWVPITDARDGMDAAA